MLRKESAWRGLWLGLWLCFWALGASGCRQTAEPSKSVPVHLASVRVSPVERIEPCMATLEERFDPVLKSEVSGQIESLEVLPGHRYLKGARLLKIMADEYRLSRESARADVLRLEALWRHEAAQLKRYRALWAEHFVSQSQFDAQKAAELNLRMQYEAAKRQLERLALQEGKTEVRAPSDGQVDQVWVAQGDYVQPGTPLLHFIGGQGLRIRLSVPQAQGASLALGQKVRVNLEGSAVVKETKISEILPVMDAATRSVVAIAYLAADPTWRPGSILSAHIVMQVYPKALQIPSVSIVLRARGPVVYVLSEQGDTVRERSVILGKESGGWVHILQGVALSDRVVTEGAGFLHEGSRVHVLNLGSAKAQERP